MAIIFPGEPIAPEKPDLGLIESFDNSQVGGLEKFGSLDTGDATVGGFIVGRTGVISDFTTISEVIIGVTNTDAARTINLASAATEDGKIIIIKDESGAAGTNNITIATEGAETIDGAATKTINSNYGVLRVYSDGTNWFTW